MSDPIEHVVGFKHLFTGRTDAYGTGKGRWVRSPVTLAVYSSHVRGLGEGLGIAPLTDDGMVSFASIDLDEPNFELAIEMMGFLPGVSFLERSRSGNAHVHVFFEEPIAAWIPRGIMREATVAVGRKDVEIFPKQDVLREGMLGNYINLPYFGDTRPIVHASHHFGICEDWLETLDADGWHELEWPLDVFVIEATQQLNSVKKWTDRARWLGVPTPKERESSRTHQFGDQKFLHCCAEYVIEHRDDNPVLEGHRATVYFNLAKMLSNCSLYDHDECLQLLNLVNDASPDPIPESEMLRILGNAERGAFTSTGCDDALFQMYADPACHIAKGS